MSNGTTWNHLETGSPAVVALFAEPDAAFVVSRLALVETLSAFSLKVRTGEVTVAQLMLARRHMLTDVNLKLLEVARILVRHLQIAEDLLLRHGTVRRLRTLDAVQLGVAIDLFTRGEVDRLVSCDNVVCQVAVIEGLSTVNPYVPRP